MNQGLHLRSGKGRRLRAYLEGFGKEPYGKGVHTLKFWKAGYKSQFIRFDTELPAGLRDALARFIDTVSVQPDTDIVLRALAFVFNTHHLGVPAFRTIGLYRPLGRVAGCHIKCRG
jgi:hypothetical protein